jgi:hypothetical protein
MSPDRSGDAASRLTLPHGDPVAVELTRVIHSGDLDALRRMLAERPELATAHMIGRKGGRRTPLHVAADWPGYFPAAPQAVALLLDAGADPNARQQGGFTPIHAAAQNRDDELYELLRRHGADESASLDDGRTVSDLRPA